jgi:hypothetical protein
MATGSGTGTQSTATTSTFTAEQTLKRALRLIGVLAEGETPSSPMYNDALLVWQQMYDSWSAVSTVPPVLTEATHTLTVGKRDYTIGLTGDIVRARPTDIQNVVLRINDTDYTVMPMSKDAYYGIANKDLTARPVSFFFEQLADDSRVRFDSKPDQAYTAYFYVLDPLTAPTAIDDDVSLQPGYQEAIVYNLALRLMPEYGIQTAAKPEIAFNAEKLLADLKNRYAKIPEMGSVFTNTGRYDVNSDRVRGRY